MKVLKFIVRNLGRPTMLALLGLTLFTSTSQAARIQLEVYARNRWALLIPGSNTGGAVVWNSGRNCYITDRALRGEQLRVTLSASHGGEYTFDSGYYYTCTSRKCGAVCLPFTWQGVVSTNPNCDDYHWWIWTNCDYKDVRVPIGSR